MLTFNLQLCISFVINASSVITVCINVRKLSLCCKGGVGGAFHKYHKFFCFFFLALSKRRRKVVWDCLCPACSIHLFLTLCAFVSPLNFCLVCHNSNNNTQKKNKKKNVSVCAGVRLATAWWNRSVCGTEPTNNAQLECASNWLATHITLPKTHTHTHTLRERERNTHAALPPPHKKYSGGCFSS